MLVHVIQYGNVYEPLELYGVVFLDKEKAQLKVDEIERGFDKTIHRSHRKQYQASLTDIVVE